MYIIHCNALKKWIGAIDPVIFAIRKFHLHLSKTKSKILVLFSFAASAIFNLSFGLIVKVSIFCGGGRRKD